jgi:hypothetical protein
MVVIVLDKQGRITYWDYMAHAIPSMTFDMMETCVLISFMPGV